MLAALKPESLARLRFPLGELHKPEVRADRGRGRAAGGRPRSTPRTCASWPARAAPASWSATARSPAGPGEIVDSDGDRPGPPRRPAPLHRRPAPRDRHRRHRAAVRARTRTRDTGRVTVGTREELQHRPRGHPRRAPAPRRAPREPRQAALSPAPAQPPAWPATRARAATASLSLQLAEPVDGAAPGQLACLMDGDVVVGWGTIDGRRRHLNSHTHDL